jgi:hypothetical protein
MAPQYPEWFPFRVRLVISVRFVHSFFDLGWGDVALRVTPTKVVAVRRIPSACAAFYT